MKYTNLLISALESGALEDDLELAMEGEDISDQIRSIIRFQLAKDRREWEEANLGPDEYRRWGIL